MECNSLDVVRSDDGRKYCKKGKDISFSVIFGLFHLALGGRGGVWGLAGSKSGI